MFLLLLLLFNVVKNLILAERLVGTMVSEAGDLRSAIKDVRSVNPDNSLESSDVRGVCCTTPDSGHSTKSKQKICDFAYVILTRKSAAFGRVFPSACTSGQN